jgi:hypothetical protein
MTVLQIRMILSTSLLTLLLLGCQSGKPNEAAHALLEDYIDDVTGFAGSASGMMKSLANHESRVDSLKGQVPGTFILRYRRLLAATRLLIAQKRDERETQQIVDFVKSVTGISPPADDNKLIVAAAGALSEEVLRLDMLLDGETDLNKVRLRYAERLRARKRT